jgi:sterol desaturase/sphingolipid hydroxylase (fatty acid hydroxylase superfamily)
MDSYHYSKKDYDSLDTISATFIGLVNVAISAVLKIGILNYTVFYNRSWVFQENGAYVLCIIALDFFRYWSHRLTHVNRFGGQPMLHIIIQKNITCL